MYNVVVRGGTRLVLISRERERERACHSWMEVSSGIRVTCWIPEEHQAGEPWCSRLLLIHHTKGHISPCYRTTSISTANQVHQLVVIESYGIPRSISRLGSYHNHNSPYKYSLSWDTRYHVSRHTTQTHAQS